MTRRKVYNGQIPCPRAGCRTTLSRITDIPRHIKDIHELDIDKWSCPYPSCKYKGAKRRDNAMAHIREKHLVTGIDVPPGTQKAFHKRWPDKVFTEPQGNVIGRINPEPILENNRTSQVEESRGGASSMTAGSPFHALTNSSFNNPLFHKAYTTSPAVIPPTTKHPTMKCFADYESSYPSPAPYSTAPLRVKPNLSMAFQSDCLGADEDFQRNLADISGSTWSERCSSDFDTTVWDHEVAFYHWDNPGPVSNRAYTYDWKKNHDQK